MQGKHTAEVAKVDIPKLQMSVLDFYFGLCRKKLLLGQWSGGEALGAGDCLDKMYAVERLYSEAVPGRDDLYAALRDAGVLGGRFTDGVFIGLAHEPKLVYLNAEIQKRCLRRIEPWVHSERPAVI